MALGKRKRERQLEAFVTASDLPQSPGHPFYTADLLRPPVATLTGLDFLYQAA